MDAAWNSLRRCAHAFMASSELRKKNPKKGMTISAVLVLTPKVRNRGLRWFAANTRGAETEMPSAAPLIPAADASSTHLFLRAWSMPSCGERTLAPLIASRGAGARGCVGRHSCANPLETKSDSWAVG